MSKANLKVPGSVLNVLEVVIEVVVIADSMCDHVCANV